jgi:DNA invertase Pin-like site-specific DNA recombinase
MRVTGYARVSTALQKEWETIKTQAGLIERFCKSNSRFGALRDETLQ